MPAIVPLTINAIAGSDDPRKLIQEMLAPAIGKIKVFGAQVLVATYIMPDRTRGGILLSDKTKEEALWQGSIGLVVKKGPWAFRDDPSSNIDWQGQDVEIGDWVLFRFSSAWEQHFNGLSVRFVEDRDIRGVIDDPRLMSNVPML